MNTHKPFAEESMSARIRTKTNNNNNSNILEHSKTNELIDGYVADDMDKIFSNHLIIPPLLTIYYRYTSTCK